MNSITENRLKTIATSVAPSREILIFGSEMPKLSNYLNKFGFTVRRHDDKRLIDKTVISINHTDDLTSNEKQEFLSSNKSAAVIILCGQNIHDKHELENIAFSHGFRIHPAYFSHIGYDESFDNGYFCILEKIKPAAKTKYSMEWLLKNRSLHMDMSRENGVRSDAHLIRYQYASNYIRPGDTVLDCACGLGYGSNIIRTVSNCSSVTGRDLSDGAIAYAKDNFDQLHLNFEVGDAQKLDDKEDNSIDAFISFETLEHVPEPELIISEAARVLRPGGRFIASVPYDWSDETGEDPNPFHLHVYNKEKLLKQVKKHFNIEAIHIQNAGGGYKLPDATKSIFQASSNNAEELGEWLLIVGYKKPLGKTANTEFSDTIYPYPNPTKNLLSFARDYENPWLMRTLFGQSIRVTSQDELLSLANEVLENYNLNTPDYGAALCVKGYALLENKKNDGISDLISQGIEYVKQKRLKGHAYRWSVSIQFLMGLLCHKTEDFREAKQWYHNVCHAKWKSFSPTLGTKAAEAAYRCGMMYYREKNFVQARRYWSIGLNVATTIFSQPTKEIIGDPSCPLPDPMKEVNQALEIANKCGDCLRLTSNHSNISDYAKNILMTDDGSSEHLNIETLKSEIHLLAPDAIKWRNLRNKIYNNRSLFFLLRAYKRLSKFKNKYTLRRLE